MADTGLTPSPKRERPLSPHLSIYHPTISMVMSIVHRITGSTLYIGALGVCWWLFAAAHGPQYYAYVVSWFADWPGQVVLFGYTWALMHHMFGGIRHFIWDTGAGHDLKTVDRLSWGTLIASVSSTALIWFIACTNSASEGVEVVSRGI